MLTLIPGETEDDLFRIAIDLPEFLRIPKEGHITDYSKAESTARLALLHYFSTQFVIHFVAFHYFFIPSLAIHYNPSSKGLAVATSEQIALLPLKNK